MNFSTASLVEQAIWDMKLADQPRGRNRAQIDRLFNGYPPWTNAEAEAAQIKTNVNFLDAPKLAADARRSYYNAFLKPGKFFSVTLDSGPMRRRASWGNIITKEINRIMKRRLPYFETTRSQIANTVLHGIGPLNWETQTRWKPRAIGVEDLLLPSNTLLSLENLNYFAIWRQYTAPELQEKINRVNRDPAWNVPLAKQAIAWCFGQGSQQRGYTESMDAEKIQEQIKQDGVFYGSDSAPTIDVWDFYFYSTDGAKHGWRRRMVIDTPASTEVGGDQKMPDKNLIETKTGQWLYDSKDRVYASDVSQILHFQFGDLSAVAPFKYHSVRSLGWLIYAVCNLQNRLKCKINDATFENLLQYFRVANTEDHERLTKIDLHNFGIVPEGVDFIKQGDRWQINHGLITSTVEDNRNMMNEAAAQFREGRQNQSGKEKTATEIMAEVNSANALVGSMLLLAYTYQAGQYEEIARRFCKANSDDQDVMKFRERVMKKGVPANMLDVDFWEIEPEKVLGSGNKMLQIAMADKLMQVRPLLDPDAQRDALRMYIAANSDDPELAMRWVPDKPIMVTESIHDAQLMIGTIMNGVTLMPRAGQEPGEIVKALLAGMAEIEKRIMGTTKIPTMQELVGLSNLATTIGRYNSKLAEDVSQQGAAKQNATELAQLTQVLKKWGNDVKQQQEQAAQAQQDQGAALAAAETKAKIEATTMAAQTSAKIAATNAAQEQQIAAADSRQQQQINAAEAQQEARLKEEKHKAELAQMAQKQAVQTKLLDLKTATEIRNSKKKADAAAKAKPKTPKTE